MARSMFKRSGERGRIRRRRRRKKKDRNKKKKLIPELWHELYNRSGTNARKSRFMGQKSRGRLEGRAKAGSFDFMNVCRKVMTSILRGARRSRLLALTELACPRLPFCQLYLLFHSYWSGPQCPFKRASPWPNEKTERTRSLIYMDIYKFARMGDYVSWGEK